MVIGLIDHLIENYSINPNRIYLTGLSMGGYGTWQISHEYPERFAAIAPIAGGSLFVSPYSMERLKELLFGLFMIKETIWSPIKNQFGWWRESMRQEVMPN